MSAVIIPARYGSTRFPGKVLADIGGEPMICRVAKRCLETSAENVVVVTDNEKVRDACRAINGVNVIMSPSGLATGTDRVAFAAKRMVDDIIINVQGDEPFIPAKLIDSMIEGLASDTSLRMITACTSFKDAASSENPSAVKVVTDKSGYALYFSRWPVPYNRDGIGGVSRFRHIGVYGFRRDFLFKFASLERTPLEKAENLEQLRALENGVRIKVIQTGYNPISIDTPADLEAALNHLKEESL